MHHQFSPRRSLKQVGLECFAIAGRDPITVLYWDKIHDRNSGDLFMAGGFAKDGAVQEQIDATVEDAVKHAREQLPGGASLKKCEACEALIPEARREAVPGVRLCISCQSELDKENKKTSGYNRRGSKDSQLR